MNNRESALHDDDITEPAFGPLAERERVVGRTENRPAPPWRGGAETADRRLSAVATGLGTS
jgi:hypothetical protein